MKKTTAIQTTTTLTTNTTNTTKGETTNAFGRERFLLIKIFVV